MLRSIKELRGYNIITKNRYIIGHVHEFYFDDQYWAVRYLVFDRGNWLLRRRVLISPVFLGKPDWNMRVFPLELTKKQVKKIYGIDRKKPVYHQHKVKLAKHYSRPTVLTGPSKSMHEKNKQLKRSSKKKVKYDPHLRSTREVIGYRIHAMEGDIGHLDDFIVEDSSWIFRYLVVDTQNWLPGKKVLLAPNWSHEVDWEESKVRVNLNREHVKNSPEFDPSKPVNRELEVRLYDYYGRPKYWE